MAENQKNSNKRPPNFRFEIPGNEEYKKKIQENLQRIKSYLAEKLRKPVNNADVMEELLQTWNTQHDNESARQEQHFPCLYNQVKKEDVDQVLFVTAESSLSLLGELFEAHKSICSGSLKTKKKNMKGHVVATRFQCSKEKTHSYLWSSSPYMPNDEYLVNYKINHGFLTSGILAVHYIRFSNASGIGCIGKGKRKQFFQAYKEHTENEYKQSVEEALVDEIGRYEELDGINIMSDARHGWRKNAKDTSVVALGEKCHKVLDCVHVTKTDDPVSQRHERVGTAKVYDNLNSKNVDIKVHTHDRNLSINKFVRDTVFTINQNDLWHAIKKVKKSISGSSKGPKLDEGIKWFDQLSDKIEPVATHIHWAVRRCENSTEKLKMSLDNIVNHYSNEHDLCSELSPCRYDPAHEPSRIVITSKKARKILESIIKKSPIYTSPSDYILAKDTSYVESFNNVMNIFQDKRISFSDDQCNFRSFLAVCHWNENVDRGYTSIWKSGNPNAPKNQKGKKIYKKLTYNYRCSIWNRFVDSFY